MTQSERFAKIYDVLVKYAGARADDKWGFIYDHTSVLVSPCDEWRFCGALGFGGKYRRRSNTVDCYREDETPGRLAIIEQTNKALREIGT